MEISAIDCSKGFYRWDVIYVSIFHQLNCALASRPRTQCGFSRYAPTHDRTGFGLALK